MYCAQVPAALVFEIPPSLCSTGSQQNCDVKQTAVIDCRLNPESGMCHHIKVMACALREQFLTGV